MGNSTSQPSANNKPPVCLDCDKSQQKDLPGNDPVSSSGQPCAEAYKKVSTCMEKYDGQVSSCKKEWEAFQQCHESISKRR
jgi:hypothetical protein